MCHKSVKVISLIVFFLISSSSLATLKVGDKAPNFSLRDQNNLTHELNDYKGNWVVLYFYPRDSTPGCTNEGIDFTTLFPDFKSKNVEIFGISRDSINSHEKFKKKI